MIVICQKALWFENLLLAHLEVSVEAMTSAVSSLEPPIRTMTGRPSSE